MRCFLAFVVGALAAPGVQAFAQANITTTPTAVLYVDALNGSDSNLGSQLLPLRTLGAAAAIVEINNNLSIGTDVRINPGIYRETVTVQGNWKQTTAPMIFEAVTPGTAIVSGSNVLTGWVPQSGSTSIYETAWPYNLTGCTIPSGWPSTLLPVTLRTEMIFINGNPIAQVMSLAQMRAGTFFIDDAAHIIHLWPASQVNMQTAVVETGARSQTWSMNAVSNVILRGLVFQEAASCMNVNSVQIMNGTNVLLDNVQALWNNWGGLGVSNSNQITIQNSTASHNGGVGLSGTTNLQLLLSGNETSYNNWRGAMGAFYDWGMGGTKFLLTHTGTATNQKSFRNQAQGLWFDTDSTNVAISNATLSENLMGGLQAEANQGPVSFTNGTVCSNGAGINVLYSVGLSVTNSLFYNNSGTNHWQAEIFLAGAAGGRPVTDWQTGQTYQLYTSYMTFTGNQAIDESIGQFTYGTYMSLGYDWTQFTSTLKSDNNTFYDVTTPTSFKIPGVKAGKPTNLAGWQSLIGTDQHSVWQSLASEPAACVVPAPSFTDFAASANLSSYTMVAGTVTAVLRIDSYNYGQVNLAVTGLPAGVTAKFDVGYMISGISNLTFTAAPTAVAQTVPITIFANSGARVHPITILLKVVPPAA